MTTAKQRMDAIAHPPSGAGLVNVPNALTTLRLVLVVPFTRRCLVAGRHHESPA